MKKTINLFFNFEISKTNKNIEINDLECGYENFKTSKINLSIPFGTKISVLGKNGSGKTTFIKTILGEIQPLNGEIYIGNGVKFGYISQDTLNVNNDESVLTYLTKGSAEYDLSKIFVLLDKVNISYDDKNKLYASLSPGERTRINIVKLVLDNINTLILDEVTNHLDREAIELIYELVSNYPGTIISISHNRKFNDILDADMRINIENGQIEYKDEIKSKKL